jgi:NAD(P)H-dependent flavin oxidoreductase YrpB (nitropropane dioxygenase family)
LLLSGQSAGLIKGIKPVKVIIEEIMAEAETIIKTIGERMSCG